jgi:hypothetical protein
MRTQVLYWLGNSHVQHGFWSFRFFAKYGCTYVDVPYFNISFLFLAECENLFTLPLEWSTSVFLVVPGTADPLPLKLYGTVDPFPKIIGRRYNFFLHVFFTPMLKSKKNGKKKELKLTAVQHWKEIK